MVDLAMRTPCAGRDPVAVGTVTLEEVTVGPMASLTPFGEAAAMAAALEQAHGLAWPAPGETSSGGAAQCLWFGRREVLLLGVAPDLALAAHGAVVDQSDAWAVVALSGVGATDVLARLVPLDLRDAAFPPGRTARSPLLHMNASVTKRGPEDFMIMVFRSMVETLYHDLEGAMAAVASRG